MDEKLVAKYLNAKKAETGLSNDEIAKKAERSVSTVNNLCSGKTEDPRLDTVAPVVYAVGGSIDEMLNPGKGKASSGTTISHCEKHIDDIKESNNKIIEQYEKRINEKSTIIKALSVLVIILISIFIVLFIMEIMHPEHGWLRY